MKRLSERVFSTGILNPNLRVFDVIMRTEFGTSYNSYVVRGSEATAVIDSAHPRFAALYAEELEAALGGAAPAYLIVNHTEPDHSGCIAQMLERWPALTIVTNSVAAKNLRNIVNRDDLPLHIVQDGASLSLGDRTLLFRLAPFLHWPDTMFTYLPEEQTLFPCDVFGCHYCEPGVLDTHIAYPADYETSLRYYYDCIFGPFPGFVQKGLAKLADWEIQRICPSHGPVLTKGCRLEAALSAYAAWSAPEPRNAKRIPLFYCTAYGNTRRLAQAIRNGILSIFPDADAPLLDLSDEDPDAMGQRLNESDAFLLGTPTINRDAPPPLWNLLARADAVNLAKRPAAVFGSFGWSGEGPGHIALRLQMLKCAAFAEPHRVCLVPSAADLEAARDFGAAFAAAIK
ncbi:MAG: FprA family A-type flavoprotein [Oscillospiraceae bacterium]|jgi:flavorubredoxin|nr:FprA family A-type flavoprotein [Oscillospiraceae bacterium]